MSLDPAPQRARSSQPSAAGLASAEPARARLELVAETPLQAAVTSASRHLLELQFDDGHWCAELEGDTILESEYLMLLWFLGRRDDPRFDQGCRYLRSRQLDEGGWAIFPGGPPDPSPSVKAYFMLKLCGDPPDAEHMQRARESIRRMGGIAACNSFTKIYLAMFGQWPWSRAPAVPPELILLPRWFPINIYEMSSWSRAIVVPLAILWAHRPRVEVPVDLAELDTGEPAPRPGDSLRQRFWFAFFRGGDRFVKLAERLGLFAATRGVALRRCERWTTERLDASAGLGAIFPAIVNAVVALRLQGYPEDHPFVAHQLAELEKLEIVEPLSDPRSPVAATTRGRGRAAAPAGGAYVVAPAPTPAAGDLALRVQPCQSPVWDTALSLNALLECGVDASDARVQQGLQWLLEMEVRQPGDWQIKNGDREVEPSGWFFEYANGFYPDCDDTAEVLAVLGRARMEDPAWEQRRQQAVQRALRWQLSMQNRDGGWGAFDRECSRELLTYVPFADHNAMIDPSTVDVTSRTVEALVLHLGQGHPSVQRALAFIERSQEADGTWFGRWGSNYLYGTWLALCALAAAGRRDGEAARRGVQWLLAVQREDGGWGESLASYVDPSCKGAGPSTAAQTAWALLGLMAVHPDLGPGCAPDEERDAVRRSVEAGVARLVASQEADGGWRDVEWTGTGFPAVFYLRYHFYDRYFPLQALATAQRCGVRGAERRGTAPGGDGCAERDPGELAVVGASEGST
ncbi:MAG: squalene--hopene cyclase [Acidobacteria bacterium]|nr:MAG: squalene--hopene cyclase [Acidobacteriota bacterium]REK12191.1 MAG: squalene--hopene cyclase [Acidobacteriota bacterium]